MKQTIIAGVIIFVMLLVIVAATVIYHFEEDSNSDAGTVSTKTLIRLALTSGKTGYGYGYEDCSQLKPYNYHQLWADEIDSFNKIFETNYTEEVMKNE